MGDGRSLAALMERGHWGIKCGLENIRALLARLGHPEAAAPVILVAGTNGKGSTGAFLAHALRSAGRKTGWTTSPHLVSPTERIWIDGASLLPEHLDDLLEEVFAAEAALGLKGTFFELMIASAFLAFKHANVDLAVVEVGMGGRWDATNASEPVLTVLTNVEMDHMQYLGDTREAIAREKLCTAREGRPLVLGPRLDPGWITPLLPCRPQIHPAPPLAAEVLAWDHSQVAGHRVPLAGAHQIENLATAWEALRCLEVPEKAIWRGVETTYWPGRLWTPPELDQVTLDGAHNLDGARRLAEHARATGVRPHLIFGAMGDKDLRGMHRELLSLEPLSITLARGGNNPRYATAEALREVWGQDLEVLDIAQTAERLRRPLGEPRLVCGSLYFMGDLLNALGIDPRAVRPR